jgi:cation diffusion facilitator CzcD-associated flavoprotein CzcO
MHELDAIILATGFDVSLSRAPFPVAGRGGRCLDAAWGRGAVAYKGLAVSGFPNYFILMGPNTGPGHTSVLIYSEAQIAHVLQAIRRLRDHGLRSAEVRREVQDRYNARLQRRMKYMVWSTCQSWYLSQDGRNHTLYPGFAAEYALRTRRFHPRDYELTSFA